MLGSGGEASWEDGVREKEAKGRTTEEGSVSGGMIGLVSSGGLSGGWKGGGVGKRWSHAGGRGKGDGAWARFEKYPRRPISQAAGGEMRKFMSKRAMCRRGEGGRLTG